MEVENRKINFKYNFKEYLSFILRYKFVLVSLLISIILFESLAFTNSLFFKKIIDNATLYLGSELSKELFVQFLIYIAIAFSLIALFRVFLRWIGIHLINILEASTVIDLKSKYFNHILELSHKFHTTHKTGSLISRISRGTSAMESLTDVIVFQIAPLIVQFFVVGLSVLYFNKTTGLIILFMSVVFIGYSFYLQKKQEKYKLASNKAEDTEKGFVSDIFTNIDSVKYFGKENIIKSLFKEKTTNTKEASLKTWQFFRWLDAGQILILSLGTFFILFFSLKSFLSGGLTLGELTFIYTIYGNIIGPMYGFVWGLRGFYRSMADFQDLFEYGKIENEVKDAQDAKELKIKEGKVEFKDISFDYEKRKLFEDFNLKINSNEKVALVGHSGCGKTTLVKLLYRFYDLLDGKILIDNKNISKVKQESLRSEMSIVPQEAILFDDTIYNNIKFANPNSSRKEILDAIKFAQLDEIVKNFPEKENTIVGERGVKLSGGEKQRVSIARAILANKKIIVLDEATSALDSKTENEIQKGLAKLLQNRTSIIIAHRLSTIMNADRIVVLKQGKIIEQGTHNELLKNKGEYYSLWKLQKGGYIK